MVLGSLYPIDNIILHTIIRRGSSAPDTEHPIMSTYSLGTSTSFTTTQNAMNPRLNGNQRSMYQQIVGGIRITGPIPANYYTTQFDTDGNKLVAFATKVALQHRMRGEYEKNLKKIVAGAKTKAHVFACTSDRAGHCVTHITGAHAQSAEDASKVRNIIRGTHDVDTWRQYAGKSNHTGRTAQAHAHSREAHNVADIFSNVPISKAIIKKLAKEHGMSVDKYQKKVMQNHLRRTQGNGNNWNTGSNRLTRSGSGTPSRRQHRVGSVSNLREHSVRGVPKNNSRTRVNSWLSGGNFKGTSTQSMRSASSVVGSTGRAGSVRNGSQKAMSTSTRGSKLDFSAMPKNQREKIALMIHERMKKEAAAGQQNGATSLRQRFGQVPSTSANSGNTRKSAQNVLKQRLRGLTPDQAAEVLRKARS